MPRKLSDSAKEKRVKKMNRRIEQGKDVPAGIKHPMIEGLYRIGWDAVKISKEIGIPLTVSSAMKTREPATRPSGQTPSLGLESTQAN